MVKPECACVGKVIKCFDLLRILVSCVVVAYIQ